MSDNYFSKFGKVKEAPPAAVVAKPPMKAAATSGLPMPLQMADDAVRAFGDTLTFGGINKLTAALPEWLGGEADSEAISAAAAERSPGMTLVGRVAGNVLPASKISRAIGTAVPILGRAGLGRAAIREGATAAALTGAHQLAEEGEFDPGEMFGSALLGGAGPMAAAFKSAPYHVMKKVFGAAIPKILDKTTQTAERASSKSDGLLSIVARAGKGGKINKADPAVPGRVPKSPTTGKPIGEKSVPKGPLAKPEQTVNTSAKGSYKISGKAKPKKVVEAKPKKSVEDKFKNDLPREPVAKKIPKNKDADLLESAKKSTEAAAKRARGKEAEEVFEGSLKKPRAEPKTKAEKKAAVKKRQAENFDGLPLTVRFGPLSSALGVSLADRAFEKDTRLRRLLHGR